MLDWLRLLVISLGPRVFHRFLCSKGTLYWWRLDASLCWNYSHMPCNARSLIQDPLLGWPVYKAFLIWCNENRFDRLHFLVVLKALLIGKWPQKLCLLLQFGFVSVKRSLNKRFVQTQEMLGVLVGRKISSTKIHDAFAHRRHLGAENGIHDLRLVKDLDIGLGNHVDDAFFYFVESEGI